MHYPGHFIYADYFYILHSFLTTSQTLGIGTVHFRNINMKGIGIFQLVLIFFCKVGSGINLWSPDDEATHKISILSSYPSISNEL